MKPVLVGVGIFDAVRQHYIREAFHRTSKPGLLLASMEHAMHDPKAQEAESYAILAGTDLAPGWLYPFNKPLNSLVPTLAQLI